MITVWQKPARAAAAGPDQFTLAPHVSLVLADDGTARLLDMGGGFYALPAVGARMLLGTLERGSAAAVRELAQRYRVPPEQVEADLDALLKELLQKGLVRRGDARRPDPVLWLAMIFVPSLLFLRGLCPGRARAALALTVAKLSLVCFGWARTVTVWRRCLGRSAGRANAPVDEPTVRALDGAVRDMASGHPLPMACKERGLACWALLHWAGVHATLVIGLEFFPLVGHCWCEAGPLVLSDYADHCEFYTPVLRYA